MRIISREHDFYDVIQKYDEDRSLIYERSSQEIKIDSPFKYPNPLYLVSDSKFGFNKYLNVRKYLVGFCGKVYPMVRLWANLYGREPEAHCYSVAEIDTFIRSHYDEEDQDFYFESSPKWKKYLCITKRKEFSSYFEANHSRFAEYFYEYKTPIFIIKEEFRNYTLTINGSLKEIEFYRIFDTNSAYQEISLFLGNELVEATRQIPRMGDQVKINAHGFNELSFRKEKTRT